MAIAQHISFPGCMTPSLGVELEVSLVDLHTGELVPRAPEVLAQLAHDSGDDIDSYAKPELFRSIIELTTGVCSSVAEVRADLAGRLQMLQRVCEPLGMGLICTGTHPTADWRQMPITDDVRYQYLLDRMAWPARRLLICGMHVHVGVKSGEHAIAVMNALQMFLPHMLALSASSPYWKGLDTGMASCRALVFEGLPASGLPPVLRHWGDFTTLMHTLARAGSVMSIREIWWDIRPHPTFGTIEVRICDGMNTLAEICAMVALIQTLVVYLQNFYDAGCLPAVLPAWILVENKWRAARFGKKAQLIVDAQGKQATLSADLNKHVALLADTAHALGCFNELQWLAVMLRKGPNYQRQRRMFDRYASLQSVVACLVDELQQDSMWCG